MTRSTTAAAGIESMANEAPKPTLQEIAAMPYPASERAMREFYDKNWGRYSREGDLEAFKVEIEYSIRTREFWECEVKAVDVDEAERIARDRFDDECPCSWDEFDDIENVKVERAEQVSA